MRRSPPATRQLTAIGAQKRPFEELASSDPSTPDVDATPEFADAECESDKPQEDPQKLSLIHI